MTAPPPIAGGRTAARVRAATFRFGQPAQRIRMIRGQRPGFAFAATLRKHAANADTAQDARIGNIRAEANMQARRTAEKRPPAHGEMEHVNDIYGGLFADGTNPGSA